MAFPGNLAQRWQQQEEVPWGFLLIFLDDSPWGPAMFSELKDRATTKEERATVTTVSAQTLGQWRATAVDQEPTVNV